MSEPMKHEFISAIPFDNAVEFFQLIERYGGEIHSAEELFEKYAFIARAFFEHIDGIGTEWLLSDAVAVYFADDLGAAAFRMRFGKYSVYTPDLQPPPLKKTNRIIIKPKNVVSWPMWNLPPQLIQLSEPSADEGLHLNLEGQP
jgi:hypothetical protein